MCELITIVVIAHNKFSTEIFAPCDWDLILIKLMTDGTDLLCSVTSVTLITVANEVCESNVFPGLCLSTGAGGGGGFSVFVRGGIHPEGSLSGGLCPGSHCLGCLYHRDPPVR